MKKYIIIAIIFLAGINFASASWLDDFFNFFKPRQTTTFGAGVFQPFQGGTGINTIPTYGKMLVGNSSGTYTLTATSSLGISGAGEANTASTLGTGLNLFDTKSGVDLRFNSIAAGTNITLSTTSNNNTIVINSSGGSAINTSPNSVLVSDSLGTSAIASSSPTVNYITATSTTATSSLQQTSISGAISLLGEYFTNFTNYVRGLFTAGNGLSLSSGQYSINSTGLSTNAPITWDGTNLVATGTPNFTAGYFTATSTTATSTFKGFIDVLGTGTNATSTISGNLHIIGNQQVDGSLFAPITFTAGSVSLTSLTLTNPLGVAYGGTGLTSGYNNANWDTAYTNRITSATYPLLISSNVISTALSSSTLTASSPLTGSFAQVGTGGSLGCQTASGSQAGCLSSTDWNTFNNKQSTISTTYPITLTGAIVGLAFGTTTNNTWTGTQTFSNASTTQLTSGTNTFYVDSNGRISAKDTTQSLTGVLSPVRHLALSTATTTAWTASTTGAYIPFLVAPFAGTIQNAVCSTDASFLGIDIYVNSTHLTYFVASTTVGTMTFSSNNTFTMGQLINMAVGTTTTSGATKATCTLRITETI